MKRLIGLLTGIVLVVGMAGLASAQSDSITLKVSCVVNLSVAIDKTEYNFGDVAPRTPTISTEAIVVNNNSGGRTEDYQINSATSTASWNLITTDPASAADEDVFSLKAMFKSTQAIEGDYTGKAFLDTGTAGATSQQNMDINFGTAGYSGDDVVDGADRNLWFRLYTPWSTTDTTEQSFSVTITAVDSGIFTE